MGLDSFGATAKQNEKMPIDTLGTKILGKQQGEGNENLVSLVFYIM